MQLLIVDDEKLIRNGLMSLEWDKIGICEVISAINGVEAKEILISKKIDIVISDIRMPGLSGLEISKFISEAGMETEIILLSGFSDFNYAKEAIRSNVFDYLLKPIRTDELMITVQRAIEKLKIKNKKNCALKHYESEQNDVDIINKVLFSFRNVNPVVMDILVKMSKEFDTDITLNSIAEEKHFTSIYLSRLIKRETGYSFVDILLAIRLLNVVEIMNEKEKISSVCGKCGFKDQRHFSQVFKKIYECTPSEYKKQEYKVNFETVLDLLECIVSKKRLRVDGFYE